MSSAAKHTNVHGQPIGAPLESWLAPAPVQTAALTQLMQGRHCTLEPLGMHHQAIIADCFKDAPDSLWTYLPYGPMHSEADYTAWMDILCSNSETQQPYLIRSVKGQVIGVSAYLRTNPEAGSIEIGHLAFSPKLQKTSAATEALYLMIEAVFLLGYRRCEWKCNSLNAPSIAAAKRLGFRYEGTFRQAMIVKGANRDTAWFSIIDREWPALSDCYERWFAADNFDARGVQKQSLSGLTAELLPE